MSEDINQTIRNIVVSAIAFHLVWGAIFGFILSCLLRIRLFRIKQHYKDIINIDPNIRLVTICDVDGRIDVFSSPSRRKEFAHSRRK